MVMPTMLLCADIGGTNTKLALFRPGGTPELVGVERHASAGVDDLGALFADFAARGSRSLDAACLGVAGPVVGDHVDTTNLPWHIDARALGARLGNVPVFLLNDLEALAYGVPSLRDDGVATLQAVPGDPTGTIAVIAAGTGLGEAGLVWDGRRRRALSSEGGHTDFAPRTEREIALLRHLLQRWPHVSWERVVSGPGIVNLFEYVRDVERLDVPPVLAAAMSGGEPAAAITQAGLARSAPIATATLDLFATLYGAEAGNLALKLKALGGVYVGGGIAPKVLDKLRDGTFIDAFLAKGRFRDLLESIPVHVIVDPHTALYGAARYATEHLAD
jgi:glucokinase